MAAASTPLRFDSLEAKIESTYGSVNAPGTSDAIRLSKRLWQGYGIAPLYPHTRENAANNALIPLAPVAPTGHIVNLSVAVDIVGKGSATYTAATENPIDALMASTGYGSAVAGGNVTYTSADSGHKGVSINGHAGLYKFIVAGARSNMIWEQPAGELGEMRFDLQGWLSTDPPVTGAVPSESYSTSAVLAATSMAVSIGTWAAPAWTTFTFNTGNRLVVVLSGNAANGIEEVGIVERIPTFTITARADVATYNPYAVVQAATTGALSATLGSVAGSKVVLTDSAAQIMPGGIRQVDIEGYAAFEVDYFLPAPNLEWTG